MQISGRAGGHVVLAGRRHLELRQSGPVRRGEHLMSQHDHEGRFKRLFHKEESEDEELDQDAELAGFDLDKDLAHPEPQTGV